MVYPLVDRAKCQVVDMWHTYQLTLPYPIVSYVTCPTPIQFPHRTCPTPIQSPHGTCPTPIQSPHGTCPTPIQCCTKGHVHLQSMLVAYGVQFHNINNPMKIRTLVAMALYSEDIIIHCTHAQYMYLQQKRMRNTCTRIHTACICIELSMG